MAPAEATKRAMSSALPPDPQLPTPDLGLFFDQAADLLSIINFAGYFVMLNAAWQEVTGFRREELMAVQVVHFVHPDDRKAWLEQAQKTRAGSPATQFETRLLCKDGSYKWFSWNAVANHEAGHFYAIARDVTRRKRVESRLNEHLERLLALRRIYSELARRLEVRYVVATGLEQIMQMTHADAGFISLIERDHHLRPAQAIGGYPDDERTPYLTGDGIIARVLRQNEAQFVPTLTHMAEGYSLLPGIVAQIAVPLRPANRARLVGVLCIETSRPDQFTPEVFDFVQLAGFYIGGAISHAMLVESLRLSEEKFSRVFHTSPDPSIIIDLDNGKCVEVNATFLHNTGYRRDEVIGRPILNLGMWIETEDYRRIQALLEEHTLVRDFEARSRNKAGAAGVVLVSVEMMQLEGKPCLLFLGRDITERKRIEEEREQLIRELGAFAHTVAHDLKNPLQLVIGFAGVLEEDPSLPAEAQTIIGTIARTGEKMTRIIDELMRLASLRGLTDIPFEVLDMQMIVHEALERMHSLIAEQGAVIIQPEVWPLAQGYAPWVEEVWDNYLSNAIKYGGRPPHLELGADCLPDQMVRFWVRDNGDGLDADQQTRLFTEFVRLDQVRATGHGLGLSIVKRIIERLGGEVGVESIPGQGSTFWFTLRQTGP